MCHTIPLLKFLKVIVDKQQKTMSLLVQYGLIRFLLTLSTHMNDIAKKLTKMALANIELKLMIQKNRFAILINPVMMSYTMFS